MKKKNLNIITEKRPGAVFKNNLAFRSSQFTESNFRKISKNIMDKQGKTRKMYWSYV